MLLRIDPAAKDYPWGSATLLPETFGQAASGSVVAELWFGTHPLGEAKICDTSQSLTEVLKPLGYLVKILGVASPLSIQVHPNAEQARAGFEREQAAGIELSDRHRNYKDPNAKPELLIALTEFQALSGLREPSEIATILAALEVVDPKFALLAELVETEGGVGRVLSELIGDRTLASKLEVRLPALALQGVAAEALAAAAICFASHPSDPGALVALLLNFVTLEPYQAIFLPAGSLHAYLSGVGVEVMTPSDNVIRGGLTSKHVDVEQLLEVVDKKPLSNPLAQQRQLAHGLYEYQLPIADFQVYRAEVGSGNLFADIELRGVATVICVSGELVVSNSLEERVILKKSQAAVIRDARNFSLAGNGVGFIVL